MPRPKTDPSSIYVRELRITPPDGLPITDWKLDFYGLGKSVVSSNAPVENFKILIAAQEGGSDDVRLHYHLYVETYRSESWLKKWIYSIAHCYNGESGNTVYFSRKPHDNTIGYVVKHGNIVARHGCEEAFITEWLAKSDQYRRDKDSARTRSKRLAKAFTHEVVKKVVATVKTDATLRSPEAVLKLILTEYHQHSKPYPSRTQVETLIVTILHPYDEYLVRSFYLRSFER